MNDVDFQRLLKHLEPYIQRYIGNAVTKNTANIVVQIDDSQLIDYLKRDGSRSLLGNLVVADGKTIDGVDISVFKQSYDTHLGTDSHTIYASADGSGTRLAYSSQRLNKSITVGDGLIGGGLLDTNRTIDLVLKAASGLEKDGTGLAIADAIAGNGLGISSKVLSVNTGTGLTISSDAVIHNTGNFGDLHTNYAEYAASETITGSWTFNPVTTFNTGAEFKNTIFGNSHFLFTSVNSSAIMGKLGIGTQTPSFVLDIIHADNVARFTNTTDNTTNKAFSFLGRQYLSANPDFGLFSYNSTSILKKVLLGAKSDGTATADRIEAYSASKRLVTLNTNGLGIGLDIEPNAGVETLIMPSVDSKAALRLVDFTTGFGGGGSKSPTSQELLQIYDGANNKTASLNADGYIYGFHLLLDTALDGGVANILSNTSTPQIRMYYDNMNYADLHVGGGGNLTISPTGSLILNPIGRDILPSQPYYYNFGSIQNKWLTIHAAELWVETLVAQNTVATIGGRVLVGATSTLTRDLASGSTVLYSKYNQMTTNDIVYMEKWTGTNAQVEFIRITSNGTLQLAGDYLYNVVRNLDGSGANDWLSGDAVFNTGVAGDGFIDLYALNGVANGSSAGATIAFNVRNSSTYNDWSQHAVIGNLKGTYDYGTDVYGFAAGKMSASTSWLSADAVNGIRIMRDSETLSRWYNDGSIQVGRTGIGQTNILINSAAIRLRANVTNRITLNTDGTVLIGETGLGQNNTYLDSTRISMRLNTTPYVQVTNAGVVLVGNYNVEPYVRVDSGGISLVDGNQIEQININTSGAILLGQVAASKNNILLNSGEIRFRNNLTTNMLLKTSGEIVLGNESGANVTINSSGVRIEYNGSERITLDSSGNAYVRGTLTVDSSGMLLAGTTTNGVRIDNTSLKVYTSSTKIVDLNTTGLNLTYNNTNARIRFVDGSNNVLGFIRAYQVTSGFIQDKIFEINAETPIAGLGRATVRISASASGGSTYNYDFRNDGARFDRNLFIKHGLTVGSTLVDIDGNPSPTPTDGVINALKIGSTNARGCIVAKTTTTSLTVATPATITWNSERYDTDNCFTALQGDRMTAQETGYYLVGAGIMTSSTIHSGGLAYITFSKNGTSVNFGRAINYTPSGQAVQCYGSSVVYLVAGDYVQITVRQDTNVTQTISAALSGDNYMNQYAYMFRLV